MRHDSIKELAEARMKLEDVLVTLQRADRRLRYSEWPGAVEDRVTVGEVVKHTQAGIELLR